ncbi:MAG: hypothetical protein II800_09225 [Lachnospiraceae bacterium]|nr:hypothetical protein [Lachnospiraceae bacterium]
MKFSDKLYAAVTGLWREAAEKPFVREMAAGTLEEARFRNYMIQDYRYLIDYMEILRLIRAQTEDAGLREFLQRVIDETENETYRVHLPHMKSMGVREEEIAAAVPSPAFSEYTEYMRQQVRDHGFLAGITALLQCSWLYAFIGEKMAAECPDTIRRSPYRFWFDAYTCEDYTEANRMWIDTVDRETGNISSDTESMLMEIFTSCAEHENRLWDELYDGPGPFLPETS